MALPVTADQAIFLSSLPVQRRDRRRAFAVVILSLLIFAVLIPFARRPLLEVWAFIPVYESALAITDLITAAMLFGQFNILRARALYVLAAGYLFTAFMTIPHALTFPGLFAPKGLFGAGPQSTAWLYMCWHGVFPVVVITYGLLKGRNGETVRRRGSVRFAILLNIAITAAAVAALATLATAGQGLLPDIMRGNHYSSSMIFVIALIWTLSLVALSVLLLRRPHTVLDLWLMVVMCAWLLDVALSAGLNAGRFDVGFYAGRAYGLLAATTVLLVLLLETGALYAKLATLLAAEQKEHRLEAEERRRIFDTSLDLILVVDRKGTFLRVSPSSTAILGFSPEEMVGRNAIDFLYPDDLNAIRSEMRRARRGHLIRNFATRYFHKNGHIVMLEWSGVWSEPEQRHFFIGRDVTEQKRIARMKDEFIATVNHELRTPVTAIAGPLGLLMGGAGGNLPDAAVRLIGMAQTNCKRLTGLLSDILDFERIKTGKMTFDFQRIDAKLAVERAIEANRPFAKKFNVRVKSDLPTAECAVYADPDRLTQVMANLLSNAVKFSPPGGEVLVSIEKRDRSWRIAVRDHGPGIPDDYKTRIFDKFAQVDASDARLKGGTGLGLSIVKEIMNRLGGEVGCYDAPSGGTIFHIDVPRYDIAAMADRKLNPSSEAA